VKYSQFCKLLLITSLTTSLALAESTEHKGKFTFDPKTSKPGYAVFNENWKLGSDSVLKFRARGRQGEMIVSFATDLKLDSKGRNHLVYELSVGRDGNKHGTRLKTQGNKDITAQFNMPGGLPEDKGERWTHYWIKLDKNAFSFGTGKIIGENNILTGFSKSLPMPIYFGLGGGNYRIEFEKISINEEEPGERQGSLTEEGTAKAHAVTKLKRELAQAEADKKKAEFHNETQQVDYLDKEITKLTAEIKELEAEPAKEVDKTERNIDKPLSHPLIEAVDNNDIEQVKKILSKENVDCKLVNDLSTRKELNPEIAKLLKDYYIKYSNPLE
jgi:hypothetical protein